MRCFSIEAFRVLPASIGAQLFPPAGSGKTSFAKSLSLNFFEADQYFEKFNNNKFDHKLLKEAHRYCYDLVKKELFNGNSAVVSNTMSTINEVLEYQNLAKEMNVKFVSMILENRHDGISVHDVPKDSIEKMSERFDIQLK